MYVCLLETPLVQTSKPIVDNNSDLHCVMIFCVL